MRKVLAMVMAAVMVMSVVAPAVQAAGEPSGAAGFFTGCCFGLRTGADYNDLGTGNREFLPWFLVGLCIGPRTAQDYRDGKDFHWPDIVWGKSTQLFAGKRFASLFCDICSQ